jgi:hypothetical protein
LKPGCAYAARGGSSSGSSSSACGSSHATISGSRSSSSTTVPPFSSRSLLASDRLRGTPLIARVERWFGGTVLIGLGLAAAIVAPHRSN